MLDPKITYSLRISDFS